MKTKLQFLVLIFYATFTSSLTAQKVVDLTIPGFLKIGSAPNNNILAVIYNNDSLYLHLFDRWGNHLTDTTIVGKYNVQLNQPLYYKNAYYLLNFKNRQHFELLQFNLNLQLIKKIAISEDSFYFNHTFSNIILNNDSFYFLAKNASSSTQVYFVGGSTFNGNYKIIRQFTSPIFPSISVLNYQNNNFYVSNLFRDTITIFNNETTQNWQLKGIYFDFNFLIQNNYIYSVYNNLSNNSYDFKKYTLNMQCVDSFSYTLPQGCKDNFGFLPKLNRFTYKESETFYFANEYLLPGNLNDKFYFIAEVNFKTKQFNIIESNINQKHNYLVLKVSNYPSIYGFNHTGSGNVSLVFPEFKLNCNLHTYPNPSIGNFTIPISNQCLQNFYMPIIKIYNNQGKLITNYGITNNTENEIRINANLPYGLYHIMVNLNHNVYHLKHIIAY